MAKGNIHSYPSVYALGHAALAELLDGPVVVEEKVDGSQFNFGRIDGEFYCRSKGRDQTPPQTDALFDKGVEAATALDLHDGWVYRAEYLRTEQHNALTYARAPRHHLALFDVSVGDEQYLAPEEKLAEAERVGLECVPAFFSGVLESFDQLKELLETESFLGGPKVEGVVIKNYARFGRDKKALMGKFVSEGFKETHTVEWRKANPNSKDIVAGLIDSYRTEARWQKSIQHLRDNGQLEGSPRDIGPLLEEIVRDVKVECEEEIKAALFKWAWSRVGRGVTRGFPEWYKERLAESQFTEVPA